MAGLTYICENDISSILQEKCIDIEYLGVDGVQDKKVCGRDLIDFLNGYPLAAENADSALIVTTGNDLKMLSPQCLLIDDYKVCWDSEPVARPFDFIDNRCAVDRKEEKVICKGPRAAKS